MRNRRNQRKKYKINKAKEEYLDSKTVGGADDPTPQAAIRNIKRGA